MSTHTEREEEHRETVEIVAASRCPNCNRDDCDVGPARAALSLPFGQHCYDGLGRIIPTDENLRVVRAHELCEKHKVDWRVLAIAGGYAK